MYFPPRAWYVPAFMSTRPDDPPPADPTPTRPADAAKFGSRAEPRASTPPELQDSGSKGDLIALGIGCGVFVILLVAIVLVGMSGR